MLHNRMTVSPHVLFILVREWNETSLKSKDQHQNTAANPGCPMGWWKETTQRATNINPAVPEVTQRFQWLKHNTAETKFQPHTQIWPGQAWKVVVHRNDLQLDNLFMLLQDQICQQLSDAKGIPTTWRF